jgi:ATP-binding cassette subfamily C (CFTR/MRP) protein 1
VLKLYAWEESFEKQINEIREKETGMIRKQASIGAHMHLTWSVTPFLVSIF